jgi:hypothetical protein
MAYAEPARYQQDAMNSRYLSSSLSGLSHSRSTNSLIVRTYKQATQLYLTKRFREALDTLESIVSPPPQSPEDLGQANGVSGTTNGVAPVAQSSKGTRTKVWVFYLSLIHAIVELGVEEGKLQFGSARWRQIAAKAREGSIWEEVVRYGYSGEEAVVDPDVVVNLATLLLGHMQSQKLNQQRLESYLASSAGLDGHVGYPQDGLATPMSIGSLQSSSPRDLATRLRILELYALHVLPANDEWDYAESFIEMNDTLDEERRETFLLALQGLKDEKEGTAQRERELEELREREMEERREAEEAKRREDAKKDEERRRAAEAEKAARANNSGGSQTSRNNSKPAAATNTPKPPPSQPRPSKTPKKNIARPPNNILTRASLALSSIQQMILQASKNLTGNNVALARFLVFMMAFLLLLTRRGLRMKVKKAIEDGWVKVRQTVGMGVKVSYI